MKIVQEHKGKLTSGQKKLGCRQTGKRETQSPLSYRLSRHLCQISVCTHAQKVSTDRIISEHSGSIMCSECSVMQESSCMTL